MFYKINLKKLFKKINPWLIIILGLSAFLRFYRLSDTFALTIDEEYQAELARSIVNHFHIIWIGVSATNIQFYLGPFWTYFTAFWLWISKGNIIVTGYVSASIGVITTLAIYYFGLSFFNQKTGLIASLLYASLPLFVFYDQKFWNPTLLPLLSLSLLFCLFKVRKDPRWWVLFTTLFGLIFHTHLSLIPYSLIAVYVLIISKKPSFKIVLLSILTFIVVISPLIAFDYFHKWSNITAPLRFKQVSQDSVNAVNPVQHFNAYFQTVGRMWYLKPFSAIADETNWGCSSVSVYGSSKFIDSVTTRTTPNFLISLASLLLILSFVFNPKNWKEYSRRLVILGFLITSVAFLLYTGGASEYYLLGALPLVVFIPGIYLTQTRSLIRSILTFAVVISVLLGIYTVVNTNPAFSVKSQREIIKQVQTVVGNSNYEIQNYGDCHETAAWRWLFRQYFRVPTRSTTDQILGWIYPKELSKAPIKYTVKLNESRIPVTFSTKPAIRTFTAGGFTAYIYKH